MQLYIAYKYTNIKNKTELKINLEHIVQLLENKGHATFLLNRDAKAWGKRHVSTITNIFTILKNIMRSDAIFAYINSEVLSKGIISELLVGKVTGKRMIVAIEKQVESKNKQLTKLATEVVVFDGIKDLESKIDKIF